jgi:hypothetical protein
MCDRELCNLMKRCQCQLLPIATCTATRSRMLALHPCLMFPIPPGARCRPCVDAGSRQVGTVRKSLGGPPPAGRLVQASASCSAAAPRGNPPRRDMCFFFWQVCPLPRAQRTIPGVGLRVLCDIVHYECLGAVAVVPAPQALPASRALISATSSALTAG